ncbi:hypothetical protein BaRGS_00006496, partial [Batillaria attramentaria]
DISRGVATRPKRCPRTRDPILSEHCAPTAAGTWKGLERETLPEVVPVSRGRRADAQQDIATVITPSLVSADALDKLSHPGWALECVIRQSVALFPASMCTPSKCAS